MGGKWGRVFRNNYKGQGDKTKVRGGGQGREVRMAGVGGSRGVGGRSGAGNLQTSVLEQQ